MITLTGSQILEGMKEGKYNYTIERTLRKSVEYRVFVNEWNQETVIRVHVSEAI